MKSRTALSCLVLAAATWLAGCDGGWSWWPGAASSASQPQIDEDTMRAFDKALADAAALRYEDAAKQFAALMPAFENSPSTQYAADCMFWMAFCYEKSNRKEQAVVFYREVPIRYPGTKAADMAAERLANVAAGAAAQVK